MAYGGGAAVGKILRSERPPQYEVRNERVVHRRIQELAINGHTIKEIAAIVGREETCVSNLLRQPWAQEQMVTRMQQTANEEIKALLESAAPGAVQRIIALAEEHPNTEIGFKADMAILDRFMGKPTQPITQETKDMEKMSDAELERIASGKG